jgi:hypothetical protein
MSDLGAIFHVKKAEVQYDAHAYTTLDECPEPNLKIKFNGSPAYIKLEAKGSGDVPCYVKKSDGSVYQIKKEAKEAVVPTGEKRISVHGTFTVPSGITVLEIEYDTELCSNDYVGVTPGSTHKITIESAEGTDSSPYYVTVYCNTHRKYWADLEWAYEPYLGVPDPNVIIRWSPEINKKSPTRTDY